MTSPVLGSSARTTRTVELHDSVIPEGAKVMLHYGAANRDPSLQRPGRFDVDRDAQELRSHLAFGFGPHVCLAPPFRDSKAGSPCARSLSACPDSSSQRRPSG